MRMFAGSRHDKPWEYIHNGYISAVPGENTRSFKARIDSDATRIMIDDHNSRLSTSLIMRDFTLAERENLYQHGLVIVPDERAEILKDWLTQGGIVFSLSEA